MIRICLAQWHILLYKCFFSLIFFLFFLTTAGSISSGPAANQSTPGMVVAAGNASVLPAFEYRGTWIPIMTISIQGSAKAT